MSLSSADRTNSECSKTRLAIFASGGGSNAERILEHFRDHPTIEVALVAYNRKEAGVRARAERFGVPTEYLPRAKWQDSGYILKKLNIYGVDFIALAGFLLLIPEYLVQAFPERILNIHPALLPKFGGKGMYGANVHRAVHAAGETESGMTVHVVNEHYDEGSIVFQVKTLLEKGDTPEEIAARVLKLEHAYYPQVIEGYIKRTIINEPESRPQKRT